MDIRRCSCRQKWNIIDMVGDGMKRGLAGRMSCFPFPLIRCCDHYKPPASSIALGIGTAWPLFTTFRLGRSRGIQSLIRNIWPVNYLDSRCDKQDLWLGHLARLLCSASYSEEILFTAALEATDLPQTLHLSHFDILTDRINSFGHHPDSSFHSL